MIIIDSRKDWTLSVCVLYFPLEIYVLEFENFNNKRYPKKTVEFIKKIFKII